MKRRADLRKHSMPTTRLTRLLWLILAALLLVPAAFAQGASDMSQIGRGAISTFAGLPPGVSQNNPAVDDLPANQYKFSSPTGIAIDSLGNIYIADQSNNLVYIIYEAGTPPLLQERLANPPSTYSTTTTATVGNLYIIAGLPGNYANTLDLQATCQDISIEYAASSCGDGGSALLASLGGPTSLAFDSAGNLYIADQFSQAIRKLTYSSSLNQNIISTYVGDPMHVNPSYTNDGFASLLSYPNAIALDSADALYIADQGNAIIRKIDTAGTISTVAGTLQSGCTSGNCGDGGLATSAQLNFASGLFVASTGDIYITDQGASTIRKVTASTGNIASVAGTLFAICANSICGDGSAATAAQLNLPAYASLDSKGNLAIADAGDNAIRYVDSSGTIHAAVGVLSSNPSGDSVPARAALSRQTGARFAVGPVPATGNYGGDSGPASAAQLNNPVNYAFDPAGNLFIADNGNGVIREVLAPAPAQPQTITFAALPNVTYNAAPISLTATASSGLAVTYTVTGPATLNGSTLTLTGAGTVAVTATQPGNTNYAAATPVTQSFTVAQAALTVTADNKSRQAGQPNPPLTYSFAGFIGADTAANAVTGAPVLTLTPISGTPNYTINIAIGTLASTNYTFTLVNGTLSVVGATAQIITFNPLPNQTYGVAPITLTATASSGVPVTYTVTGPARLVGSATLSVTGAGAVSVTAQQLGNGTYAPAPTVTQSFTVGKAPLTITPAPASRQYGQPDPAFSYTVTGLVNGDTTSVITGAPIYTDTATSTSDPGAYPVTLTQGTLAAQNYTFTFAAGTLTITPAAQTITFPPLPSLNGNSNQLPLSATATSGLPVTYTATGVVSIVAGNILQVNGVGAATVTALQTGNTDYAAAAPVTQNITIAPISLTVYAIDATRPAGTDNPVFTYRFAQTSIVPGTVTGTPVLTTTADANSPPGTYAITISQGTLASSEYSFVFVPATLTVTPLASYTLTASPTSVTIPAGQARQVTIIMTPINNYQGSVTLGCNHLPAGVTCVASPATLTTTTLPGAGTPSAQGTLTISAGPLVASAGKPRSSTALAGLLGAILGGLCLLRTRRRAAAFFTIALALVAAFTLGGITACGSGKSSMSSGGGVQPGTTTIQVTGSAAAEPGTTGLTQTVDLQVVIQ